MYYTIILSYIILHTSYNNSSLQEVWCLFHEGLIVVIFRKGICRFACGVGGPIWEFHNGRRLYYWTIFGASWAIGRWARRCLRNGIIKEIQGLLSYFVGTGQNSRTMTLLYDWAKSTMTVFLWLASLEKYRYLAEQQKNDNIDDWPKATGYFKKDTMTLLKE